MHASILIIDPIAPHRIQLQVLFARTQYRIEMAASLAEARTYMKHNRPVLIVTTDSLNDQNPLSFVCELKARSDLADIPVIVLSRYGRISTIEALRAGAADLFAAPFIPELILTRVRSLLRHVDNSQDTWVRAAADCMGGLSEAQRPFDVVRRISVIGPSGVDDLPLFEGFKRHRGYRMSFLSSHDGTLLVSRLIRADAAILVQGAQSDQDILRLLVDMRAHPMLRELGVIIIGAFSTAQKQHFFDLGAHEVIETDTSLEELILRIGVLVERKKVQEQQKQNLMLSMQAAIVDPLTGAFNRRFVLPRLQHILTEAYHHQAPCSIAMLDIDHFRAVNTTYGHVTGDHVLRNVADILRHSARSEDIVARMGGEEFLIVMPNCAQDEGHHVADQMRRAIHGAKIAAKGADTPISVSVSIGLISAPSAEFPTLPDSLDEVIARADAALYLSKEAGRNQVSIM